MSNIEIAFIKALRDDFKRAEIIRVLMADPNASVILKCAFSEKMQIKETESEK